MEPQDLKQIPNEIWMIMEDPGMSDVWPAPRTLDSLLEIVAAHDPETASDEEKRFVDTWNAHGSAKVERPEREVGESAGDFVGRLKAHGQQVKSQAKARRGFRGVVLDALGSNAERLADLGRRIDGLEPAKERAFLVRWEGEERALIQADLARLAIAHQISAGLGTVDVRLASGELLEELGVGDIEAILQSALVC